MAEEPQAESDILEVDFTGVKTDFDAMPIGVYPVRVSEKPTVGPSKKSGEKQVSFVFEVTGPEEEYVGRKLFLHCSLQKQALWKLRKTVEALGVPVGEGLASLDLPSLVGLTAFAQVGQGEYNGKMKNELIELLPADGSEMPEGSGSMVAPF